MHTTPTISPSPHATGRWQKPWRSASDSARPTVKRGSAAIAGAVMISDTRARSRGARPPTPSSMSPRRGPRCSSSPMSNPYFIFVFPLLIRSELAGGALEQGPLELLSGAQEPGAHRGTRDGEALGNLVVAAVSEQPELVHLAERALEVGERGGDLLIGDRLPRQWDARLRASDLVIVDGRLIRLARQPPASVDEQVVHDCHQPDAQVRAGLEAGVPAKRVLERVLHQVPRVLRRVHQADRAGVEKRLVPGGHLS